MASTLIVPGLHSSGPDHWQTWFEEHLPGSLRVIQRDWRDADLPEWSSRVRRDINRTPGRLYLVGHSFGALAAVQAAEDLSDRVAGALLVAPADPVKFRVAEYLPSEALPFPTVVVASSNDPWIGLDDAARLADTWRAEFVNLGEAGHINAEAGFGPWPEGLAILERLKRLTSLAEAETKHEVRLQRVAAGRPQAGLRFRGTPDERARQGRLATAI